LICSASEALIFRLNVYYIMLDKIQSFADGKYDLERKDIEGIYFEQRGDAGEQLEELQITKKGALHSTGMSRPMLLHNVQQHA
jgi:amphiphysin